MKIRNRQIARTDLGIIKVYKITPGKDLNPCHEAEIKNILPWLEMAEKGDILTIEVLEMPFFEYDNLPEYMGP